MLLEIQKFNEPTLNIFQGYGLIVIVGWEKIMEQYSSLDLINEQYKDFSTTTLVNGLAFLVMKPNILYAALTTVSTCSLKLSSLSKITPKSFTVSHLEITLVSIV